MSKKSWLRNLIFEESDSGQKSNPNPEKTVLNSSAKTTPPINNIEPPRAENLIDGTTITGRIDKVLLNKLCTVLDEQASTEIDYVKFKKTVDSLKSIQPEEDMRFSSAFLALKVTNPSLSKEYLTQTIEKYMSLMEQERKVGMDQLRTLRVNNVDKKTKEIEESSKNIEKMKAEVQRLSQFIAKTEAEIVSKKNEIAIKEADFNATIDHMIIQLKNDKTKIETIIK